MVGKDSADEEEHAPGSSDEPDGKTTTKGRGVVPGQVGPEAEAGEGHDHDEAHHKNPETEAVVAPPSRDYGQI